MTSPIVQKPSLLSEAKSYPAQKADARPSSVGRARARPSRSIFIGPIASRSALIATLTPMRAGASAKSNIVMPLCASLSIMRPIRRDARVTSVFFGGGTPSLMSAASVGALLDRIAALWPVDAECEITLEANPSSVESARFAGYRAAGVNRVSLGVQSLSDEQLRFLGRLHSAEEARAALQIAAKHFERMSFDLIYARPKQSEAEWRQELMEALNFARGHVSLYQLTIEPQTAFFDLERRGRLRIPDADFAAGLYELTQEICEGAGLPAYEVSNHAAPGQESRHNLTYWRYGDYLGIGPGAHGRVRMGDVKIATAAIRAPGEWYSRVMEQGAGTAESCELSRLEQAEEMILMGLRLREGLSLDFVVKATGFTVGGDELQRLVLDGLVEQGTASVIRATNCGQLVLNAIVTNLVESLTEIAFDRVRPA